MSLTIKLIITLITIAGLTTAIAAVHVDWRSPSTTPGMTEEQRATRQKFFGTEKSLAPIVKGQEMRPRW
ncbi:entry exclusion protein TrbK [Rhizobium sp. AAP43]|uniref:entry exclusion protein TrbK n=1 Tax=Rhizobium sp. AAP43 TaxID=1523420 RepID=UPI0006B9B5F6|nr:entry exclusion protein TrbK [Rhizobium sp. AAP43]KPF41403.1 hypothetical protein IP76_20560 [Rhizobium sp. AAP43]